MESCLWKGKYGILGFLSVSSGEVPHVSHSSLLQYSFLPQSLMVEKEDGSEDDAVEVQLVVEVDSGWEDGTVLYSIYDTLEPSNLAVDATMHNTT